MTNLSDFISSFSHTNVFPFSLLCQLLPYFDVWYFWENTDILLKLKTLAAFSEWPDVLQILQLKRPFDK